MRVTIVFFRPHCLSQNGIQGSGREVLQAQPGLTGGKVHAQRDMLGLIRYEKDDVP